ncbi:MAG: sigma-70 family RNA polymerase sigma factor [Myxococcota bacterium]
MNRPPSGPSSKKKRALAAKRERQQKRDLIDRTELAAWQAGDKKAGKRLFAHYYDRLHDFFGRRINRDIADLVQETLAVCVENPKGFAGKSRFEVYLFGIANNKLKEYFREHARDPQTFNSVAEAQVVDPGPPLPGLLGTGQDQVLLDALRGLDWKHQIAFELYVWEVSAGPSWARRWGSASTPCTGAFGRRGSC